MRVRGSVTSGEDGHTSHRKVLVNVCHVCVCLSKQIKNKIEFTLQSKREDVSVTTGFYKR